MRLTISLTWPITLVRLLCQRWPNRAGRGTGVSLLPEGSRSGTRIRANNCHSAFSLNTPAEPGKGAVKPVVDTTLSIPLVLESRAQKSPDDIAFTFIDYEVDPNGFAESVTWSQLHQRVRVAAAELGRWGTVGDRAAILAPQSLEYIVAFLGAMEAGFIVVPLSVPMFGAQHDERISAALRTAPPSPS